MQQGGHIYPGGSRPLPALRPGYKPMAKNSPNLHCVILADRHLGLAEGMRGLLESVFGRVFVVGDVDSLQEGARSLSPAVIVVELSLAESRLERLLQSLRDASPESRVIVITVEDEGAVARVALAAGAAGVVQKRCAGSDLLAAVDAVLLGHTFVSTEFGLQHSAV